MEVINLIDTPPPPYMWWDHLCALDCTWPTQWVEMQLLVNSTPDCTNFVWATTDLQLGWALLSSQLLVHWLAELVSTAALWGRGEWRGLYPRLLSSVILEICSHSMWMSFLSHTIYNHVLNCKYWIWLYKIATKTWCWNAYYKPSVYTSNSTSQPCFIGYYHCSWHIQSIETTHRIYYRAQDQWNGVLLATISSSYFGLIRSAHQPTNLVLAGLK